jgi:hypothetical protein
MTMYSEYDEGDKLTGDKLQPGQSIRGHLRLLVIDLIGVASFPLKVALQLTAKWLEELAELRRPPKAIKRNFILDCGKTSVAANSKADINVQCYTYFRPTAVIIPSHIASSFSITDIKVGKNSQLLSTRPIPATSLAFADGTPIPLQMDVASPMMWITLSVLNTSDKAVDFEATIVGIAAE